MINKAILVGRVGNEPERKEFSNGNGVTSFSLATSESWKDKDSGEKKEKTEWHNIKAFGKLGEIIDKYVNKGSLLYIEGKIVTESWETDSGEKRYRTTVDAKEMKMLGGKGHNSVQVTTSDPEQTGDLPF